MSKENQFLCRLDAEKKIFRGILNQFDVNDGVITEKNTGIEIEDIRIEELDISTRTFNALMRSHKSCLSDILASSAEEIAKTKNFGAKCLSELNKIIVSYLENLNFGKRQKAKIAETLENCKKKKVRIVKMSKQDFLVQKILVQDGTILDVSLGEQKDLRLAPMYACNDGYIYNVETLKAIKDMPVTSFSDNLRHVAFFNHYGIEKLSHLCAFSSEEFQNYEGLGEHAKLGLVSFLDKFLKNYCEGLSGKVVPLRTISVQNIKALFFAHRFEVLSIKQISDSFPSANYEDILFLLAHLLKREWITEKEGGYSLKLFKISDCFSIIESMYSIEETNPCSRYLTKIFRKMVENGFFFVEEDEYIELVNRPWLEKDFFLKQLKWLPKTLKAMIFRSHWFKRNIISDDNELEITKISNPGDIERICAFYGLSSNAKNELNKYFFGEQVIVNGKLTRAKRADIIDALIDVFCEKPIAFDKFADIYSAYFSKNGLIEDEFLMTDNKLLYDKERLSRNSLKVLWGKNKKIRHFDIENKDFSEIVSRITSQYAGKTISTNDVFDECRDLMEKYNIQDGYELHNLLRKVPHSNISIGKMPTIILN